MSVDVAEELAVARRCSLSLLDELDEDVLVRQHSPIMSPLVWDLAHVGNYEELWLVRALGGEALRPDLDDVYDAFRHPRPERPSLPLLGPAEARRYVAQVRDRALELVVAPSRRRPGAELALPAAELIEGGFVYGMVVQHEHQHDETMLATLQLAGDLVLPGPSPAAAPLAAAAPAAPIAAEVLVPGGPFEMGTSNEGWAYDNERPVWTLDLAPFWIDTVPVTNAAFEAFIDDGGYGRRELWSDAGWEWVRSGPFEHPGGWRREGAGWVGLRFGLEAAVAPTEPVQHVCFHEADAYARWAGRRLPTEAEWEKAASWTPDGTKRRWPWGDGPATAERANLGRRHQGPSPVGSYPEGASAWGVHQLVGDVWEWTASEFGAYPGFRAFPYREYSEVFFDRGYRVLRGGSWATHPSAMRTTFRNWDLPMRRQIFAGFRCARDA